MKAKLIGSSNSIERLRDLVDKYFCYAGIAFISIKDKEWRVKNSSGFIDGCRVVEKRGRYRFEMITEEGGA